MHKNRGKIHQLAITTLGKLNKNGNQPSANEIYFRIKQIDPNLKMGGFKSFVKVLNSFPEVEGIQIGKGKPFVYKKV